MKICRNTLLAVVCFLALGSCHSSKVTAPVVIDDRNNSTDRLILVDDAYPGNYLPESFLKFLPEATLPNVMTPKALHHWERNLPPPRLRLVREYVAIEN